MYDAIKLATEDDINKLEEEISLFNKSKKKVIQNKEYKQFAYVLTENEEIIAGCIGFSSLYYIGYIDSLWVKEERRGEGFGSSLLEKMESEMRNYGCHTCHLETFDFQAPNFYKKNGYKSFGALEYKKIGLKEFFFYKEL
ncbi:hypothetical protein RV11_GL003232 [Enterococcus phoeniculicola]|jgi:N-acetylglutamate synthase-like GNAT family acetyltransferase|uniref:N-acetyltransferase domain-containing protein n=1 Tax=Enterococcus phoeniculicola ATCC BAA-412 TaxID=1158610 RepID=R3U5Q0_9ENTE|nr:GNAT family N-acetyltransferase [Enterococcus phoeniculicola]EOL48738.1 hypothetical protein UC3_00288 [Enterococcus phoeniculicola ATCC BAA-412]EOT72584.1 hypothetical protein I589_02852 [Enterococcus phoeniculicola ATCC BAA-412]OJG71857.1 hypothetical protein RV11_GL003232 [Enterococcus phoeniculicola]